MITSYSKKASQVYCRKFAQAVAAHTSMRMLGFNVGKVSKNSNGSGYTFAINNKKAK